MAYTSQTQIAEIKKAVAALSGEEKTKYLRGLRDGVDLSQIICDEKKTFDLAADAEFRAFLDYLDSED